MCMYIQMSRCKLLKSAFILCYSNTADKVVWTFKFYAKAELKMSKETKTTDSINNKVLITSDRKVPHIYFTRANFSKQELFYLPSYMLVKK